jgi:hypothetical protein
MGNIKNNLKNKIGAAVLAAALLAGAGVAGINSVADSAVNGGEEVAMMPVWEWALACIFSGGEFGNGGDAGYYCILDGYVIWY